MYHLDLEYLTVSWGEGQNQGFLLFAFLPFCLPRLDLALPWVAFEDQVFPSYPTALGFKAVTTTGGLPRLWWGPLHYSCWPGQLLAQTHLSEKLQWFIPCTCPLHPRGPCLPLCPQTALLPPWSAVRALRLLSIICIMLWTKLLSSAWNIHCKGIWGYVNAEEAHNQKLRRFIIKLK